MVKALWFVIWLIILLIFSFWIAGFIAFFYIILYPVTVCIPDLSVSFKSSQVSRNLSNKCFHSHPGYHGFLAQVHSVPEILRRKHDGWQALVLVHTTAALDQNQAQSFVLNAIKVNFLSKTKTSKEFFCSKRNKRKAGIKNAIKFLSISDFSLLIFFFFLFFLLMYYVIV